VIAERGRLDGALAAAIVAQVAGALDAAHEEGVVHRGVSCENISLDPDLARPHAYLSDLSLSRGGSRDRMTQVGVLFGLTPYAAPEVVTGVRELDGRADIYSLGCVLFESLAGRLPFPEANPLLGILARTSQPPPSVLEAAPGIDPRWEHVLATAMATGPGDRYGTAGELGRAAQEIAGT
jgi:serine/threonine protein kinase